MGTSVYAKYPPDHTFGGKKVLNIGCGFAKFKAPNVINIDAYDNCKPDIVHNLEETPLPLADESIDYVIANHIIEHVNNGWALFCDISRVLKPNGVLEIWVPGDGADSVRGYRDHVAQISSHWFSGTFGTYRNPGNAWAEANQDKQALRLKLVQTKSILHARWWLRGPKAWLRFCGTHLRNVILEQAFIFRKVTEGEMLEEQHRYGQHRKQVMEASV